VRLLLDEMIGPRVAESLRELGLDAIGIVERTDLRSLADEAVLEYAQDQRRIVVTRNVPDFARLDHEWRAAGRRHQGLVMVTENVFPQNRNLVGALVAALAEAEELERLPRPNEVLYLRPATTRP
jgi:predicted nuclease of predicted toxin-antitoxin system